jgi:hypothetical protein
MSALIKEDGMLLTEIMVEEPHLGLSMAQEFARALRALKATYPLYVYVEGNGSFHASEELVTVSDSCPKTGPGTCVYGRVLVADGRRELIAAINELQEAAKRRSCEAFKLSRNSD